MNTNVAYFQKLPICQYGGNYANFFNFMRDYYVCSKAYGWPERIMIMRLPLYLKGAAVYAYRQLNPEQLDTWAHCKDAFSKKLMIYDTKNDNDKRNCDKCNLINGNEYEINNATNKCNDKIFDNVISNHKEFNKIRLKSEINMDEQYSKNDVLNLNSWNGKNICLLLKNACDYEINMGNNDLNISNEFQSLDVINQLEIEDVCLTTIMQDNRYKIRYFCNYEINMDNNDLNIFDEFQSLNVINVLEIEEVHPITIIHDNTFDKVIEVCNNKFEIRYCVDIMEPKFSNLFDDIKTKDIVNLIDDLKVSYFYLIKDYYQALKGVVIILACSKVVKIFKKGCSNDHDVFNRCYSFKVLYLTVIIITCLSKSIYVQIIFFNCGNFIGPAGLLN